MTTFRHLCGSAILGIAISACGTAPGQPRAGAETRAPNEVLDFNALYASNCAGCHGVEGRGGAAIALANPVYLAVADDAATRRAIARGVAGTSMPAFLQRDGGMLTATQIDVIATGIRSRWSRPGFLGGSTPPPYVPASAVDASLGLAAYGTYCQSCHVPVRRVNA